MNKNVDLAQIEKMLELLSTTPHRLAVPCMGIDPARLNFKSAQEPWSANNILAHLRACANIWGKSMLTGVLMKE